MGFGFGRYRVVVVVRTKGRFFVSSSSSSSSSTTTGRLDPGIHFATMGQLECLELGQCLSRMTMVENGRNLFHDGSHMAWKLMLDSGHGGMREEAMK